MGRYLRRVPLNFDYPIKKKWEGYLNPIEADQCEHCEGDGSSYEAKKIKNIWYGYDEEKWVWIDPGKHRYNSASLNHNLNKNDIKVLLDAGRLRDLTRTWNGKKWVEKTKEEIAKITPKMVNDWSIKGFGHDSINCHIVIKDRCKRLGVSSECPHCKGEGYVFKSKEYKKKHDEWERKEPPKGNGYQLWQSTSEDSPESPVFKTLKELCEYCAKNCYVYGHDKGTKEEWLGMLGKEGYTYKKMQGKDGTKFIFM